MKRISGESEPLRKELIAQKLLLHGKIKKVLSRAHLRSLKQKATNALDQNEQTLPGAQTEGT